MSIQTYALMFYGFSVGPKDIPSGEPWHLEGNITTAAIGRQVRAVTYGPFDDYSYALALRKPFVKADTDDLAPLVAAPPTGSPERMAEWDKRLKEAAETLGVKFKPPRWYVAPWRS